MKIKHKHLESIRVAPQNIVTFNTPSTKMGKTMIRQWDFSLSEYHEKGLNQAIVYLQNSLSTFKETKQNKIKEENLIKKLIAYDKSYRDLNYECIMLRSKLNIDLKHNNNLCGEILRIDKTQNNGYAITLMLRNDNIWASELRFPIIQRYFSEINKCPFDLIKVGVFNLELAKHEYISYDEQTLISSWKEINELSNNINQYIQ